MDLGLKGRRAIVTAASRGLGLATARSLAREGVDIVMNARGAEALSRSALAFLGAAEQRFYLLIVRGEVEAVEVASTLWIFVIGCVILKRFRALG